MTQQLAIRENQQIATAPTASEFEIMLKQSQMLIKSGFLPQSITTPEQALAIMLTGRELGIPTMAALNTINVIQKKPTISPQLMLALIERSGQLENIIISAKTSPDGNNEYISCTMKRKGRTEHTEIFGTKEAIALGLMGKDNYKKQAATMFRWRAVASCARVVFPDVILGLYTPDEMGAEVTDTGEPLPMTEPERQSNTVIRMPQTNFTEEVQRDAIEAEVENTKADYSDEWQNALAPAESPAKVSAETKGRLLAEAGAVGKSAKGYTVSETIEGQTVIFDVIKTGGVISCNCGDYVEQIVWIDGYRCAHKWAVAISTQMKHAA